MAKLFFCKGTKKNENRELILNRYHNVRFVIAGLTRNPLARGFRVKRGMTAFDSSLV
jgi:hypothetical protein